MEARVRARTHASIDLDDEKTAAGAQAKCVEKVTVGKIFFVLS